MNKQDECPMHRDPNYLGGIHVYHGMTRYAFLLALDVDCRAGQLSDAAVSAARWHFDALFPGGVA